MGYDTMPDKELKATGALGLYLLILRAIAMFFMAAHGLLLCSGAADGAGVELS